MILKPPKGRLLKLSGHPLARGLKAFWIFNENDGKIVRDLSGNDNHGTLVADTHWTGGKYGPALYFDGTDDYISTGKTFNDPSFTYHTYIKYDAATGNKYICSEGLKSGRNLTIDVTSNLVQVWNGKLGTAVGSVSPNIWYGITYTYDGTVGKVYIDGILADSDTYICEGGAAFEIGALGGILPFLGYIDHIMVYNRALSISEIRQLLFNPFQIIKRDNLPLIVGAAASGETPTGNAGIMTTWGGYWGATY